MIIIISPQLLDLESYVSNYIDFLRNYQKK